MRKIKKHVPGKDVRQKREKGPPCREGASLMISGALAVAFLQMRIRMRCPIFQVPFPEILIKTSVINGLTLQQPLYM